MSVVTPDVSRMLPVDWYAGEDDDDTREGLALFARCAGYLDEHDWCGGVLRGFVGLMVPSVLGVALFEIDPDEDADPWLWVIGGDLPFAYMEFDDEATPTAVDALVRYVELMTDWADAVVAGAPLDGVFPVDAEPTIDNAQLLRRRLSFISADIIPSFR